MLGTILFNLLLNCGIIVTSTSKKTNNIRKTHDIKTEYLNIKD